MRALSICILYKNQLWLVSIAKKLKNGWIDLANFGMELFVKIQGRFKSEKRNV